MPEMAVGAQFIAPVLEHVLHKAASHAILYTMSAAGQIAWEAHSVLKHTVTN
jgi:hypothetical protein